MALREWLADALSRTPVADPERCVHTHAEVASCRRCVSACPRGAWSLDDEALTIDRDGCDGCGLCVAHCPETALSLETVWPPAVAGGNTVAIACERADAAAGYWQLPCVNALGLYHIAALHQAGAQQFVLRTADCGTCPRADVQGLLQRLRRLNRVLAQRGSAEIRVGIGQPDAQEVPPGDAGRQSRRDFFRNLLATAAASAPVEPAQDARAAGEFLAPAVDGDLVLFAPQIDATRCNGCDACVRICPHEALQLSPAAAAYRIVADACSGCGLCEDVCDRQAVRVVADAVLAQLAVPLNAGTCRACGAPYHGPVGQQDDRLCHVCAVIDHRRNLFQIV